MADIQTIIPRYNMDLDSDERVLQPGDFRENLNMDLISPDDEFSEVVSNHKGNLLVPYTQPSGTNLVMCSYQVVADNSMIYWVYNSNGLHQIRRFYRDSGVVNMIADMRNAGWLPIAINFADFIDNKLLFWTDSKCRKLDISKSDDNNKIKESNIYVLNGAFTVTATHNNSIFSVAFGVGSTVDQVIAGLRADPDINAGFTFTKCNGYIEVAQRTADNGYGITSTGTGGMVVPQNYFYSITEKDFSAEKDPFNVAPTCTLMYNSAVTFDNLAQHTFQFRAAITYDNYEQSVLGHISDIVINPFDLKYNFVRFDFTDPRLNDANELALIYSVDLFVREGNTGDWRLIKTLKQSELWALGSVGQNTFDFYNDGFYPVTDIERATQPYDVLPVSPLDDKYSMGETTFDDRIGYARFKEGYDQPCDNSVITADFVEGAGREFSLIVGGRIGNSTQFNDSSTTTHAGRIGMIHNFGTVDGHPSFDVFGGVSADTVSDNVQRNVLKVRKQILPEGGFGVYLAGTDHLGITKQSQSTNLTYLPSGAIDTESTDAKNQAKNWYDTYNAGTQIGDMVSYARISGLKGGRYITRVASHYCSFSKDTGYGSTYDYNNGRAYQQTSTYLWGWFDPYTTNYPQVGDYELEVFIRNDGYYEISAPKYGITRTGFANADGDINLPDFIVRDLCVLTDSTVRYATIGGYLFDNNVTVIDGNTAPILSKGTSMEGQFMQISDRDPEGTYNDFDEVLASCVTDHNGFFYFPSFLVPDPHPDTSGGQVYIRGIGTAGQIIKHATNSWLIGNLDQFFANTTTPNNSISTFNQYYFVKGGVQFDIVCGNTNQAYHSDYQTKITGIVEDSLSGAFPGLTITYQQTGRYSVTDTDGAYQIVVWALCYKNDLKDLLWNPNVTYGSGPSPNSMRGIVLFSPTDVISREWDSVLINSTLSFLSAAGIEVPINITPFQTTYNIGFSFTVPLQTIVVLISQYGKFLKDGASYSFAKYWADDLGRRCELVDKGSFYIPFWTENVQTYYPYLPNVQAIGVMTFTLDLTGETPPPWATRLVILRTKNEKQSNFLQFPAFDVKYVVSFKFNPATLTIDATTTIQETSYETFTANRIWLGIPQAINSYNEYQTGSLKAWTFQKGDRIRLKNIASGAYATVFVDLPILDVSPDGNYFIIANDTRLPKLEAGALFEVYTPALQNNEKVWWEIAQTVGITNGVYDQLIVPISTGDTYRRSRIVPVQGKIQGTYVEDNSVSDFYISEVSDIGRPSTLTGFNKQLRQTNDIRWSAKYFPNTKLNGLSSFLPDSFASTDRSLGTITWIGMTNDDQYRQVMLVVHENAPITYYVGAAILSDLNGQVQVVQIDKVLSTYRNLQGDFGSVHPESFAQKDGYIFYYCAERKAIIRYASNGITNISDQGIRSFLRNYIGNAQNYEAIGGYDAYRKQYVLTFTIDGKQKTFVYTESPFEDRRGWHGFRSYIPECYGAIGENFYAFLDGELWAQEQNPIRCNFFGVQYKWNITLVANKAPEIMKQGQHLTILSKGLWSVPRITNRYGQETSITNAELTGPDGIQNVLKSNFNLDINTPNVTNGLYDGDELRSETFTVTIENENTNLVTLYGIQVGAVEAPPTGK